MNRKLSVREKIYGYVKKKYGIFAVRGPRGVPNSLSAALKK